MLITPYSEKTVIIIASTGRTGTAFLGETLSKLIPGAYSEHEPDVIMGFEPESFRKILRYGIWQTVLGRITGKTGLRNIARRYYMKKIGPDDAARQVLKERSAIYDRTDSAIYIESYPQWTLLLPVVPRIFTSYKIAAIVRHPVDYIGSMGSHVVSEKKNRLLGMNRISLLNHLMTRKISPGQFGYNYIPGHPGDTRLSLAWEWAQWNRELINSISANSNSNLFRYEDIFRPGSCKGLRELCSFISKNDRVDERLCSELLSNPVNAAGKTGIRYWHSWPLDIRKEIRRLCDPLMAELEYEWPSSF